MEEIVTGLRRSYRCSPLGKERIATVFPEGDRGKVFRLSGQTPRLRTAHVVFFGSVGGRYDGGFEVSELDVARGEGGVWAVNGTLGSRSV